MLRARFTFVAILLAALVASVGYAAESEQLKQGNKPEPWWPVQPRPLPLVHPLFSDDMVLQREIAAPIWGWTKPGAAVTVTFDGRPIGMPATATVTDTIDTSAPSCVSDSPQLSLM